MLRGLKSGAALALACAVGGCSSFDFGNWGSSPAPAPTPAAPAAMSFKIVPPEPLVGKWGLASYREEKDRARTEKMARVQ